MLPVDLARMAFEQGYSLHSFSEIVVKLTANSKHEIEKVYVGGKGYYCETKHLNIENNEDRISVYSDSKLCYGSHSCPRHFLLRQVYVYFQKDFSVL